MKRLCNEKVLPNALEGLTTTHVISLKTREGKWGRFKVPPEVYLYVRQLEHCIERTRVIEIKESPH